MTIQKRAAKQIHGRTKRPKQTATNIWEEIADLGKLIPKTERARMPRDGARNFDHYLDGSADPPTPISPEV
ncbi:MAG: hypothetical protein M3P30_06190 [Chloroflexota bacterium]|nr:hypothetical protein [Chloroflexota bacterium]